MNETALKERLKTISKEKSKPTNEVWKQLLLERFLARLSRSKQQNHFIFKGGMLLSQYLTIGRETTDLDFLIKKLKSEAPVIEKAIQEIISEEVEDGFSFRWNKIEELTQPHMDYPGFRIILDANFGKMKDKVQLDIGVGDLVNEVENNFHPCEYKGKPLFTGEISLLMYPVETIFAEKLETIISKGSTNSRMKDYHDVILMIREANLLDLKKSPKSVEKTFKNRGTVLNLPIQFSKTEVSNLQKFWSAHARELKGTKDKLGLPDKIDELIEELNTWLKTILKF